MRLRRYIPLAVYSRGRQGRLVPRLKPASSPAELVAIYECLCDVTRLRILNLLLRGPLCVCHFQEVIGIPQVQVSKHLAYLRRKGVVQCERHQNWMIYSLPAQKSPELHANLRCLQDCVQTWPVFRRDVKQVVRLAPKIREACPAPSVEPVGAPRASRRRARSNACCS